MGLSPRAWKNRSKSGPKWAKNGAILEGLRGIYGGKRAILDTFSNLLGVCQEGCPRSGGQNGPKNLEIIEEFGSKKGQKSGFFGPGLPSSRVFGGFLGSKKGSKWAQNAKKPCNYWKTPREWSIKHFLEVFKKTRKNHRRKPFILGLGRLRDFKLSKRQNGPKWKRTWPKAKLKHTNSEPFWAGRTGFGLGAQKVIPNVQNGRVWEGGFWRVLQEKYRTWPKPKLKHTKSEPVWAGGQNRPKMGDFGGLGLMVTDQGGLGLFRSGQNISN